ncbi:MAG: PQQ-like beta-propeller repeat protein [Bacteroidota bacterium]|nr:PQQ-like beta-propeller repeat protein [Bacteroidota bacterium]
MKKAIILLFIFISFVTAASAQTVYQWRGQNRNGVYNEKNLLKSWPAQGPQLLWVNENVGNGFGSMSITPDRIYITGEKDTLGYLNALDLKGNLLWKSDYVKEWVKTFPGSRSTPTVVGDLIYVCSGLGNLACFDTKTGNKKWFVDRQKDLHGQPTLHGHSESPLVDGDKVFVTPGGKDTNVVALNRFTGKIVWVSKGMGERPGYNAPLLIKLPQRNILVTLTAYHLLGLDAATGELLWKHEQDNTPLAERNPGYGDTHGNTVWYEKGFIYYIAGDGNGAVKLSLSADGRQIKQVWRNKTIDNFMGGFIKLDDRIYTCTSGRKDLKCIDANTGIVTDSLKVGTGTMIFADNMLYYYNQKGEVNLIKPAPEKMELVSTFKITKGALEHFSHPVISNGIFYLRHGKALMAYNIKE